MRVKLFEGFASPALAGRVSRVDLMESLSVHAADHISTQRSERSAAERKERGGRRKSVEEHQVISDERKKALDALLSTIEWDADGYVDYAEFVRRNTAVRATADKTS